MSNIDVESFYSEDNFPKYITWESPDFDGERTRILRDKNEEDQFFDWFLSKYPDVKYSVS